jgi:hypothetical protein
MVRKSGYINQKLEAAWIECEFLGESTESWYTYIIHQLDNVYMGWSVAEATSSNWMEMVIYRNDIIAVNNDCMHFVYNWWPFNDCHYVIEVNVNLASMRVSLTLLAFKVLHSHILLRWMYWPSWYVKINVICLLPHPRYEPQWSVDNLWSCILDNR